MALGEGIEVGDCELTRNALNGLRIAQSRRATIERCLLEGNGGEGVRQET